MNLLLYDSIEEILEDLISRFVINIPAVELESIESKKIHHKRNQLGLGLC